MRTFGRRLELVPSPGTLASAAASPQPAALPASPGIFVALPSSGGHSPAPPVVAAPGTTAAEMAAPLLRLRAQVLDRIDPVAASELSKELLREQIGIIVHDLADR